VLPTSVQAYPHGPWSYIKNALRRRSPRNLWRCAVDARSRDWVHLSGVLLRRVLRRGGVFHLWGHSWEIDEAGQWQALEKVLQMIAANTSRVHRMGNGALAHPAHNAADVAL
jgi:hypothetical protein